jgi:eukaryotic-like serine/threonine-protein kinase
MQRQIKDEYKIIGEIGSGGMATVYKAVQKSLDRPVAIKELKKAYHADAQIVQRFERESRMAASLQHENIVHIYDYWKKPDYGIVMEYVDGANLADIIEKTGALPVDVGVMIAIQVCDALDYAHMRGLIHRDIKPSNIMIKRNGEVKLMDFGIAQSRNLEGLTLPGTLIGTPSYMSPEQIMGQPLDSRSDIFSFGIVLYETFTGVKPFLDDTRAVTAKIVKDNFVPPRRVNSEIPRGLQWTIKKCLRKKPKRRYGSVLEVQKKLGKRLVGRTTKAASLQRIAGYLVSMNVFEAAPEQETVLVPKETRGPRSAIIAAALVLAMAVGVAGYYYRSTILRLIIPPSVILQPQPQVLSRPVPTILPKEHEEISSSSAGTSQPASAPTASGIDKPAIQEPQVTTEPTPSSAIEKKQADEAGKKADNKKPKKKKKRSKPNEI